MADCGAASGATLNDLLGISLPLVGDISLSVAIETLSTALSLYAAYKYHEEYENDTNNLKQKAEEYTAIGEEYCQKADDFRDNEIMMLEYAKDYPDTAPDQHYDSGACAVIASDAQMALKKAYSAIPSDAIGLKCQIRTEVAQEMIRRGVAGKADAIIMQRTLNDQYKAEKVKAYTSTLSSSPPNLGSTFRVIGEDIANSAMANAEAFNGAFYVASRGASSLLQRFNSQPAQRSFAPALNQFGPAAPVTVGGFF